MLSESLLLLLLAIAALAVAPALARLVRGRAQWRGVLDGFVLIAVGGLLAFHIVPEAVEAAGVWALGALLVGIGLPVFLEHRGGAWARRAHGVALLLGLSGLAVHAAVDGVALALPLGHGQASLGMAIVLHRLPAGLLVWTRATPAWGARGALALLGLLIAATLLGYAVGQPVGDWLEGPGAAIFQALIAGSLAHVLVHEPGRAQTGAPSRWAELAGAGLGILALALLGGGHVEADYWRRFLALSLASAPALLVGLAVAGLLGAALPAGTFDWLRAGRRSGQALRGAALGLPMPACSCGELPLYRALLKRGVSPTAGLAFLMATPLLGAEALALSLPLLGGWLTAARLLAAVTVALGVGWLLGRLATGPTVAAEVSSASRLAPARLGRAGRIGFVELFDEVAPWLLLGLAVAAAVGPELLGGFLAGLPAGMDVVLFAALGVPVYICASGATPLAAAAIYAGASPGAALAFLLTGPATSLATYGGLARLHGTRLAAALALAVMTTAVGLGWLVDLAVPREAVLTSIGAVEEYGTAAWLCLGMLAAAYAASIVRLGPSAFARSVLSLAAHDHGADHEHHHDHDRPQPRHLHDELGLHALD